MICGYMGPKTIVKKKHTFSSILKAIHFQFHLNLNMFQNEIKLF